MMKFIVNLATCSFLMTSVSFVYIWLSEKLKNIWSAKVRYFLWAFVLIGFLTPFKPRITSPAFEIILDSQPINKMSDIDYLAPNYFHINSTKRYFFTVLFVLWLLGFVIFTVRYIVRQQQFQSHVLRMARPCDCETEITAREVAEEMGVSRVNVVVLPTVHSPMMTGFNAPKIILPDNSYTEKELRLIIKHELTHYKRHDLVFKFFILVCKAVHWFNPFMSYISNKIDEVCELACDETVIAGEEKEGRKLYCQSIISTVMLQTQNGTPKPAVSSDFGNPKHDLQHRLRMIINSGRKKSLGIMCVIVVLLIACSSAVFGVSYFEAEGSNFSWTTNAATTYETHLTGEVPTTVAYVGDNHTTKLVDDTTKHDITETTTTTLNMYIPTTDSQPIITEQPTVITTVTTVPVTP